MDLVILVDDVVVKITFFKKNKGEARGKNRHKNNSKKVVRNLEERNVGTNKAYLVPRTWI